jgi:hypothetical protein
MRRSNRLASKAIAEAGGDLALSEFIAPLVVQYLGVRSLVRIGATSKNLRNVVSKEIERRKERVSNVEIAVKRLMTETPVLIDGNVGEMIMAPPTYNNVEAARKLANDAARLIDDEIYFLLRLWRDEWEFRFMQNWFDYPNRENDVFCEERKKFFIG